MSSALIKSIRAGLCVRELQAPPNAEPNYPAPAGWSGNLHDDQAASGLQPVAIDLSAAARVQMIYSRVRRHIVRLLRRIAAPFLHRLDLRIRLAVDRSASAAAVQSLNAKLEALILDSAATQAGVSALADAAQKTNLSIVALGPRFDKHAADANSIGNNKIDLLVHYSELLLQRNVIPLGLDLAVRTAAGYLLVPAEDPALLVAAVETGGNLQPGTLALVLSLLRDSGVLIDVGANIGTFTLPAARCVGAQGHVLAIEPAPRIAALLRRTVALNEVSARVEVQECAAGDGDGIARFGLARQTTHNSLNVMEDALQTIDVMVRRLDDIVAKGRPVNVVKIDVEGAELQVWRGMRRIVAENPDLAVVLEFGPAHLRRAGVTVTDWFKEVTSSGHTAWEIDEASGAVRPLRTSGLDEVFSCNILLIRNDPASRGLRVV